VETQTISKKNPGMIPSLYSILGGLLGAAAFSLSAKLNPLLLDTQMVLVFFAAIAAFHISLSAFRFRSRTGFLYAPAASLLFGTVYGSSIRFVEFLLEPMGFWSPQPLGILHIFGMMIVSLFAVGFYALPENWEGKPLWKKIYVKMLNASQSDRKTITAIRSEYNY
jgi:lysylphosphatidylglycerol synthetase-like protein (DUF2156 family)